MFPQLAVQLRRLKTILLCCLFLLMASSSSLPLSLLLDWCRARDLLFGENDVSQDVPLALQLASSCGEHPDARWLTELCAGKNVKTAEDAKSVFLAASANDARALCFAWYLGSGDNLDPLRRAAELGFAFAQAKLSWRTEGNERFKFAHLAAAQGERDGFVWLGICFRNGEGCEKNLERERQNFVLSAERGNLYACEEAGRLFDVSDPERWRFWGAASSAESSFCGFLDGFKPEVERFLMGLGNSRAMFVIGRVLKVHLNGGRIFGKSVDPDHIRRAKQAVAFYEAEIEACQHAVHAWTQVGMAWKVVKDIRRLIARMIWETREEALFKTDESWMMID
jgi:TPR repeat protein